MAQWLVEGILNELRLEASIASNLLDKFTFYLVPDMNPDGSQLGNHRTNANGVDLNRCWANADEQSAPEVFYVSQALREIGADWFIDVHGDESIPYNFAMETENSEKFDRFKQQLANINPHFQTRYDYNNSPESGCNARKNSCGCQAEKKQCGSNYDTATDFVTYFLGGTSILLELSFKPLVNQPETSWLPESCMELGRSLVKAINSVENS